MDTLEAVRTRLQTLRGVFVGWFVVQAAIGNWAALEAIGQLRRSPRFATELEGATTSLVLGSALLSERLIRFADVALIFAKFEGDVSIFIVETDREGFSRGPKMDKLGLRGTELCDLIMDNVRIPKKNLLGGKGGKFDALKDAMTLGKLCLSAHCVGLMQAALEEAIKYSMHRMHLDEPIFDLQAIHWLLAEMASRLEASRWLTYRAAFLKDQGVSTIKDMAITKLFVTQTAVDVCRWGMQVRGETLCGAAGEGAMEASGAVAESPPERLGSPCLATGASGPAEPDRGAA